nr:putative late blight resistance protein homolog R1A-3 [Ipomoea batatas]
MIESLCKKLRFLQAFLEDSQKNNINCPAWTDLETEIRDVAAEAESKIESKLYKHYLFYNEKTEIRDVPVKPCEEIWGSLPPISMEGLLNLHQLENLKFETDPHCPKCDSKLLKAFPPNLKKLTLKGTQFSWDDMAIISTLPNLEVLKLRGDAFCGPEWKATGNGFCKLKYLQVHAYSSLKHWSVDADHFPVLERIFLNHCYLLMEFPTGFGEINTLQLIELKNCLSLLVTSAKSLQEERRDLGDNKLVLQFYPGPRCNFRKEKLRVTKQMQLQKRKAEGDKTVGLEPLLGETSVGLKIYGSSIPKVKD